MSHLHDDKIKFLEEMAAKIRYDTIESVINAGSGHVAGPLDMADIFTAMYFHIFLVLILLLQVLSLHQEDSYKKQNSLHHAKSIIPHQLKVNQN